MRLERSVPWPKPEKSACTFYTSMDFPDGETVTGFWDIRGRFEQYIGNYDIKGKTVLDISTASGFLAFSAESLGAAAVTATEVKDASELTLIPFKDHPYQASRDMRAWEEECSNAHKVGKNAFWYAWHKYNSRVEMSYTPIREMRYSDEQFDVVIAGALLEHLADPVSAIGLSIPLIL